MMRGGNVAGSVVLVPDQRKGISSKIGFGGDGRTDDSVRCRWGSLSA